MLSYVPTSLAWPSPSPKKTQDQKTFTHKVRQFLPPVGKNRGAKKRKKEEEECGKDRLMAIILSEKAAVMASAATVATASTTSVALKSSTAYDVETSSTETESSLKHGLFQVWIFLEKNLFLVKESLVCVVGESACVCVSGVASHHFRDLS